MTVYVDGGIHPLGRKKMCHLLADTLEELHAMADRLELKREWFQGQSTPHYDLSQSKRAQAIQYGAIEISRAHLIQLIRDWRKK